MDYKTGILIRNTENYLNNYSQKLKINNSFNIDGTIQSVTKLQEFYLLTNALNLQCGDYIETESLDRYIIVDDSDIQTDIGLSKYLMKKLNADIIFCKTNDTEPHVYPAYIKVNSITINNGEIISAPDGHIDVYLPLDKYSNKMGLNDTFCAINSEWKVIGVNNSNKGIIILTCEKGLYTDNDDKTYEFINRWVIDSANKGVYDITINEIKNTIISDKIPIQLDAVVTKGDTAIINIPIKWSLSNGIATIDSNGLLTPLYNGSCIIKATYNDKFNIPYCEDVLRIQINGCKEYYYNKGVITIPSEPTYTEIVTNDVSPISLKQNDTYQLNSTTNPKGGTIIYSSSDTNIATVNSTGTVTAIGIGNCTIIETINKTSITKIFTIEVTGTITYKSVTEYVSKPICVAVGETIQLPEPITNPTGGSVTYKTSDTTLATVDDTGAITGVAVGTSTVTSTIKDTTISETNNIKVNNVGKSLLLTANSIYVSESKSITISAVSNPIGEKVNFTFVGSTYSSSMSCTDTTCTVTAMAGMSGSIITVRGTLASDTTIYTDYKLTIKM